MIFGNDFIGIYDNALTKEECEMIINRFETKDSHRQTGINTKIKGTSQNLKLCTEISFDCRNSDDAFYHRMVHNAIERKFHLYRKKHPFLEYGGNTSIFNLTSLYNIQKYTDGEGYYPLHCEHGSLAPYRMLVWMIYLNDAKCGTVFPSQKKTLKPKPGRLAIWPAAWTHPHKGVTPNVGEKYIITGWWNYEVNWEDGSIVSYDLHSDGSLFAKYQY